MNFTFGWYEYLMVQLSRCGYQFTDYHSWEQAERSVILRHDVDYDLEKALKMAEIEAEHGVKSTYFVLISSEFYNVLSRKNEDRICAIQNYGHEIGLHFDEANYPQLTGNMNEIREQIVKETEILSNVTKSPVTTISMHRPSKAVLEADLKIPGMINSYAQTFLHEFKYLSDSRRYWREPVEEIVNSGNYKKLHILTHAFWYFEREKDIHDTILEFVNRANLQRYESLDKNFRNLVSVMKKEEIQS